MISKRFKREELSKTVEVEKHQLELLQKKQRKLLCDKQKGGF